MRLESFLSANRARPFRYGDWDCFQLVRGAIQAMTGTDIAAPFRPYSSRLGYQRQMVRYCSSLSLFAFASELLQPFGSEEIAPVLAGRGDLAIIGDRDPAFGVVGLNGRDVIALAPSGEFLSLPLSTALAAWKI